MNNSWVVPVIVCDAKVHVDSLSKVQSENEKLFFKGIFFEIFFIRYLVYLVLDIL